MGKRTRATARKPRGEVHGNGKPDISVDDAIGNLGDTASATGNSGSVDGSIIDPTAIGRNAASGDDIGIASGGDNPAGSTADSGERTKRTYKRRAKAPDAVSLDIGSFKDLLYSGHAMMHSLTQSVLFEIDEADAEKMAKAIANVTRHYDVPQMAQKTVDWIMCIQTMGAVYGPRLMAMRMERAARNAKPIPQSPMAPRNVGPSPTASGPQPHRTMPPNNDFSPLPRGQKEPTASDNVAPPAPPPAPQGPVTVRRQPGLDTLDGANLPLKLN